MEPSFSKELVERYQSYFKTRYSIEFNDDEAQEGLSSLAGLYQAFAGIVAKDSNP